MANIKLEHLWLSFSSSFFFKCVSPIKDRLEDCMINIRLVGRFSTLALNLKLLQSYQGPLGCLSDQHYSVCFDEEPCQLCQTVAVLYSFYVYRVEQCSVRFSNLTQPHSASNVGRAVSLPFLVGCLVLMMLCVQ